VPGECGYRLDGDASLRGGCVHANPTAVAAELGRLSVCCFAVVTGGLQVACNARLQRQADATILEPASDMATLLDRTE
jgi:hypothetical protein